MAAPQTLEISLTFGVPDAAAQNALELFGTKGSIIGFGVRLKSRTS